MIDYPGFRCAPSGLQTCYDFSESNNVPGGTGLIKLISFLQRKPGLTPEDFMRHWLEVHVPMCHVVPGLRGYVVSTIIKHQPRADVPTLPMGDFDGVAQVWFDSLEARAAAGASAEGKRWHADGGTIIGGIRTFVTRERFVVTVPANKPEIQDAVGAQAQGGALGGEIPARVGHRERADGAQRAGLAWLHAVRDCRRAVSPGHRTIPAGRSARWFHRKLVGQRGGARQHDCLQRRREGVVRTWRDLHRPLASVALPTSHRASAGCGLTQVEASMSDQVKAIVVDPNAPGRLSVQPATLVPAAPTDVTVRVTAISLNRGETKRAVTPPVDGARPGWDFAGVVEEAAKQGHACPPAGARVVGYLSASAWTARSACRCRIFQVLPNGVSDAQASDLTRGRPDRTACAAAGRAVARPKGPR